METQEEISSEVREALERLQQLREEDNQDSQETTTENTSEGNNTENITEENTEEVVEENNNTETAEENNISENKDSESFNIDLDTLRDNTSRYSGSTWFNYTKDLNVTLIGAGGLGSFLGLYLSRLNLKSISIYDQDNYDLSNLSGQFVTIEEVKNNKAYSLVTRLKSYTPEAQLFGYGHNLYSIPLSANVIICGIDNMSARKQLFSSYLNMLKKINDEEKKNKVFIDVRCDAEYFQMYIIPGDNETYINKYKKQCLYSSEESDAVICSLKQTTYCASMAAAMATNLFIQWISSYKANEFRPLPFSIDYNTVFLTLTQDYGI